MKDSESFMPIELSNNRDKERMAKKLVRKQSTSCGLSRDFMTPMNSFVSR
jgi:hypothetical protein